jgi:transposase
VAIDRTSKFAFVELREKVSRRTAADFLRRLIAAAPSKVHTVLTDSGQACRRTCHAKRCGSMSSTRPCPCCGGALHLIGETTSEILDHIPARLRVIRICRPRYGCRACGTIHQATAPERPIAKGLATPGLLAHVLVSKYCNHLSLYRQSQIFSRQGIELDRSTLANWVGGACWWLEPLQKRLAGHVFTPKKLFADDTPIPVLDPGRAAPRPAGSGSMSATTGPGTGPIRQPRSIFTALIAGPSAPPLTSPGSAAPCRSTAIPGLIV